ncbi:protoheme IX farnesyltransferase [Bacillus mangrovi]|uniref:Protoheme IX farnesyltransferase n=1 Tax=Metabacillus mangrovi TaxID=1491830 RepID=A0A7X2S2P2_9BACI|nr:heme o synthase [Metabacillus mangrovi]MTH52593.1 protoheme IX farnesyltransferase [Metabacillus mangrovi]
MPNSRTAAEAALSEQGPHEMTKASAWKDFQALIKIGIVNSNMITAFTGLWLAFIFTGQSFLASIDTVVFTLVGSALIMGGSCAVNNYYDRDIDHIMERTKNRPTVTGKYEPSQALWIGIFMIALGMAALMMTTAMAAVIGAIGVVSYVFIYTMWFKRRYTINTVIGSIPGAVPPLIGWTAVDPHLTVQALVLFMIMFIWQPPHFLALAMKRVDEYKAANIPMLPVVRGFAMTKRQMMVWVACLLPLPFYLYDLGTGFVILATALNIGWVVLALSGFKMKDDLVWAKWMFIYSLNYLTILFVSMILFTIV